MKKIKPTLGKGLNSMLGGEVLSTINSLTNPQSEGASSIALLPLEQITPNPNQPRKDFSEESLRELADSLQQIISGERRYRAAQLAGLNSVPVYVRDVAEGEVLELALVENIQREDLSAIEIALAYQGLLEQEGATQDSVARRVGKKRSTVANYLRLLRLPAEVQMGLSQRLLEMGHARALLQIEDTERLLELYHLILKEGLSVREVEEIARAVQQGGAVLDEQEAEKPTQEAKPNSPAAAFKELEQHLGQVFGSKVRFRCNTKGKGSINIPFANEGELDRLISLLQKIQQD